MTTATAGGVKAGLHKDVDFATYLQWPVLSQSTLKVARRSMSHMKAALDGKRTIVPTDDMLLGSALHVAFLEPEMMPTKVIRWDGGTRRGAAWDAFTAEHANKVILTPNMHAKLIGMTRSLRSAVRSDPELRRWHSEIEAVEVSIVGEVQGVMMKGRIDALTPDPLFDIKKVADGDPRLFRSRAFELGYHLQAFVYLELAHRERFIQLTVEDEPPFDVVPYEIDEDLLERGREEACNLLARVVECRQSGIWPGRASGIERLGLPAWAETQQVEPPWSRLKRADEPLV